ncbi:Uma2 family endonuclease [Planctomycetaceae bacterium SH139]
MPISTTTRLTTAEQLFALVPDGFRYELESGKLCMMSLAGGRHGRITFRVGYLLNRHVDENNLGVVYAAETGFLIASNPDTVLAPDVAFVSGARHKQIIDEERYVPLAPDLIVEVLSPSDRFSKTESKALAWLDAGSKLVLFVDPEQRTVQSYRSRKQIEIFTLGESIDCTIAVPGWRIAVQDIFA